VNEVVCNLLKERYADVSVNKLMISYSFLGISGDVKSIVNVCGWLLKFAVVKM
jgi:hypothetical protein